MITKAIYESGEWVPVILANGKPIKPQKIIAMKGDFSKDIIRASINFDFTIKGAKNKCIEICGFPYSHLNRVTLNPQTEHLSIASSRDATIAHVLDEVERKNNGELRISAKIKYFYKC